MFLSGPSNAAPPNISSDERFPRSPLEEHLAKVRAGFIVEHTQPQGELAGNDTILSSSHRL